MEPRGEGWQTKFSKSSYPANKQKYSSFRAFNAGRHSISANAPSFLQRRQIHYVPVGMFANAKSSVPQAHSLHLESSPIKYSTVPKAYSVSPERTSKIQISPGKNLSKTWDFSDVSSKKAQPARIVQESPPPSLRKYNSEEETPVNQEVPTTSETKKPELPWLAKWDSDDEASSKTPRKFDKLEVPPGFDETLSRFSARLTLAEAIPIISLQNHTETTMGTVEKALMSVAVGQSNTNEGPQQAFSVFDLLVERSDWLMYREEFNDEIDYPPRDPFYSHDVVSSEFEEYELDEEAAHNTSYSKSANEKESSTRETAEESSISKETEDLDSQEDFFKGGFPAKPDAYKSKQISNNNLSLFEFTPSSNKQKSTKRSFPTGSSTPNKLSSLRKKNCPDNPLDNVPHLTTSSEFSPFNYDFLAPPSPQQKSSQMPSKYSLW